MEKADQIPFKFREIPSSQNRRKLIRSSLRRGRYPFALGEKLIRSFREWGTFPKSDQILFEEKKEPSAESDLILFFLGKALAKRADQILFWKYFEV